MMPMFSPEQQAFLQEVQKFTTDIKAVIRRKDNAVTVSLDTQNPQAKEFIPKIQEAMIASVAQSLYTMFGISGRVE